MKTQLLQDNVISYHMSLQKIQTVSFRSSSLLLVLLSGDQKNKQTNNR